MTLMVSVRLPWCFSLSHQENDQHPFSNHIISKCEQENRCSCVSKAGFCEEFALGCCRNVVQFDVFTPSQTHPKMFKIHNVCQTLFTLVVDLFIFIFIPCKYVFQHPPSHLYPKYIQILFHSCCSIFVCSFCMFSLPFFVELPRSSPVASRCCLRCDAMPSLWHGSERIPRQNSGVEKVEASPIEEWYSQWMRWTRTKVTWI